MVPQAKHQINQHNPQKEKSNNNKSVLKVF
jgi:hypothetical protein